MADDNFATKYQEILQNNGILSKIKEIKTSSPELEGDSYASKCELVTILFEDEKEEPLELFVKKSVRNNSGLFDVLSQLRVFEREAAFFNHLYPDLKTFVREKQGKDTTFLENVIPKCYYADDDLIVLQNLMKRGYVTHNKRILHNLEMAKISVEALAKFQGVTKAYIQSFEKTENFLTKYSEIFKVSTWAPEFEFGNGPWLQNMVNGAIKILQHNPVSGSDKVLAHLQQYEKSAFQKVCKDYAPENPSCAMVVCHGDFWTSNLMYKGKLMEYDECVIIDMQSLHIGSAVLDLQMYMQMAIDPKVLRENWKQIIGIYYEIFQAHSKTPGEESKEATFSLQDFIKEFQAKCDGGFIFSFYPIFGYELMKDFDENADGGDWSQMATSQSAVLERKLKEKGDHYATQIVEGFHDYCNMKTEKL